MKVGTARLTLLRRCVHPHVNNLMHALKGSGCTCALVTITTTICVFVFVYVGVAEYPPGPNNMLKHDRYVKK